MIVEVPLPLWALRGAATPARVHAALADAYAGERFVSVRSLADAAALKTLAPEGLNNTNRMELYVFANADKNEARLVALLDNLGKGASGAAVQNMNLLLGVDEGEGL
jgi:N-acetyl-gamma-glutamyl-phosphate reductase